MARLIEDVIRPVFADEELARGHDGAVLGVDGPIAFTTDSYVIRPLVFPGGDIGSLAVNGTVNDLAMCGARPLYMSVGLILEEGLACEPAAPHPRLHAGEPRPHPACGSSRATPRWWTAARPTACSSTPPGSAPSWRRALIGPQAVRPGDAVLISGDIGRHGIAVMAARENLGLEMAIESDCAPLAAPVLALIEGGIAVHCLRDLTRGGLASAAVEIAETARRLHRPGRGGRAGAR